MPTLALATGPGDPSAFGLVIYFILFYCVCEGVGGICTLTVRGVLLVHHHLVQSSLGSLEGQEKACISTSISCGCLPSCRQTYKVVGPWLASIQHTCAGKLRWEKRADAVSWLSVHHQPVCRLPV